MSCINCHHSLEDERLAPGARLARPRRTARRGARSIGPSSVSSSAAPTPRRAHSSTTACPSIASRVARMNDTKRRRCKPPPTPDASSTASPPQIAALSWRDDDVRSLMRTIAGDTDFLLTSDVHSAEQTALALQSLASALTRSNPRLLKSPMTEAIDALFEEIKNRERYEPSRFVQKLGALRGTL